MVNEKITIEEFRNYIHSQDSLGDIHYNLTKENLQPLEDLFKVLERIHWLSHEADFAVVNNKEVRPLLLEIDVLAHDAIDKFCSA